MLTSPQVSTELQLNMTSGIVSEAIFNFSAQKLDRNTHITFLLVLTKILEPEWLSPAIYE